MTEPGVKETKRLDGMTEERWRCPFCHKACWHLLLPDRSNRLASRICLDCLKSASEALVADEN
jgi:hypothetical protein